MKLRSLQGKFSKEALKSFFYNNRFVFLSYGIIFSIILILYALLGIYPFGEYTIIKCDQFHGYLPHIFDLRNKLVEGKSIDYTWYGAGGGGLSGALFYQAGGLINILAFLFDNKSVTEFAALAFLLRVPLFAVTFYIFAREKFKRDDLVLVAFSCMYSLCAYVTAYHWNPMWFTSILTLPLVALGLDRLIKEGKGAMYCIPLAVAIVAQYGTAIFLCYFSVCYFFILIFTEKDIDYKACFVKFTSFSLLAGGMAAMALVPSLRGLEGSDYLGQKIPEQILIYNPFFRFYVNHYFGMHPTSLVYSRAVANIYAGVFTLLCFPFFLFNKSLTKKLRGAYTLLLFIIFMISNVNVLTFIAHGFHNPSMLPHRFSFVYSFVLLITALYAIKDIKLFKLKTIAAFFTFAMTSTIILYFNYQQVKDPKSGRFSTTSIIVNICLILVYYGIFTAMRLSKTAKKDFIISIMLLVIVTGELIGNSYIQIGYMTDGLREFYSLEFYDAMSVVSDELANEQEFYRAEFKHERSLGEPKIYKYNGLNNFGGATADWGRIMPRLGVTGQMFANPTPFLSSLMGVKYLFNRRTPMPDNFSVYELKKQVENIFLYENPYVLPLGFMVSDGITSWDYRDDNDPFEFQDDFLLNAFGEDIDLFDPIYMDGNLTTQHIQLNQVSADPLVYTYVIPEEVTTDLTPKVSMTFIAPESKPTYIYAASRGLTTGLVTVNGQPLLRQRTRSPGSSLDAGFVEAGAVIDIELDMDEKSKDDMDDMAEEDFIRYGELRIYATQMDMDKYVSVTDTLKEGGLNVTFYDETTVRGNLDVKEDGVLFTSIPYVKQWEVYVDGKQVNTLKLGNAFLGVKMYKGSHEMEFRYNELSPLPGLLISLVSLVIFIALIIKWRPRKELEPSDTSE